MSDFSISNISKEPDKPKGENLWEFRRFGTDEKQLVPADSPDDAWRGIRWYKDEDWLFWGLVGRHDLDKEGFTEVSAQFAARNPVETDRWDENDGRKS